MAKAAKDHSRAGPSTVSVDAEERRKSWVDKRLIEYGRMRARTLGWPDVYTFTKALGERAVEDLAHERGLSLSIVRPSIIESALEHPSKGWIDGFKMADPIIRAYGMGQIPEFPGIPEGIVDLIPVDYVVNAILAVAATPQPAGRARPLQRVERRPEPAAVLRALRVRPRVLRVAPAARARPRRAQGADLGLPGQPQGREDAAPRGEADRPGRAGRDAPAEVQGDARRGHACRSRPGACRLHRALLGPLRDVHRDRGRLHGRACGLALGSRSRRRTRSGSRSMPACSTGSTTCRTCTARR